MAKQAYSPKRMVTRIGRIFYRLKRIRGNNNSVWKVIKSDQCP